ncbi:MAG: Hint domain-containing protein [Pseudomonadota bacterium]
MADNDTSQLLTVSIDDDDGTIDGDTVTNETPNDANQIATVTDASGALVSIDACYVEWTATYTGTNGQVIEVWRIELDNGLRLFAMSEIPEEGITFSTSNKDQNADGLDPAFLPQTPCFVEGTRILTPKGERPVEAIKVGDRVTLLDGSDEKVVWRGCRAFGKADLERAPELAPVCIPSGSLGRNLPKRDLYVSRQHRMLVSSKVAERMFGEKSVLVPAIKLTGLPKIEIAAAKNAVVYHHILLRSHGVIFAEGAPTESLFAGRQAMGSFTDAERAEIRLICPELAWPEAVPEPALTMPPQARQRRMIERMAQNRRPALELFSQ